MQRCNGVCSRDEEIQLLPAAVSCERVRVFVVFKDVYRHTRPRVLASRTLEGTCITSPRGAARFGRAQPWLDLTSSVPTSLRSCMRESCNRPYCCVNDIRPCLTPTPPRMRVDAGWVTGHWWLRLATYLLIDLHTARQLPVKPHASSVTWKRRTPSRPTTNYS